MSATAQLRNASTAQLGRAAAGWCPMPCAKGMARCRLGCQHRALVLDYRAERERQERTAEQQSCGYATELAEYLETHPLITFKDWLRLTAAPSEQLEVAA